MYTFWADSTKMFESRSREQKMFFKLLACFDAAERYKYTQVHVIASSVREYPTLPGQVFSSKYGSCNSSAGFLVRYITRPVFRLRQRVRFA